MKCLVSTLFFFSFLFNPGGAEGQPVIISGYTIRYEEKVSADYANLLDTSVARDFKNYSNHYRVHLETAMINDSLVWMSLTADSINVAGREGLADRQTISFLFSQHTTDPLQNCLYLKEPVPSVMFVCARNIVSNILFYYPLFPLNSFRNEPFIDGIYSVRYIDQQEQQEMIKLRKEKKADHKPGNILFRNLIDSFTSTSQFDRHTGALLKADLYEKKRQKIGRRTLADVITRIEVKLISQNAAIGSAGSVDLTHYSLKTLVYNQLSYLDRLQRTARSAKTNLSLSQLLRQWDAITPGNAGAVTTAIRNSLALNILNPAALLSLMDSLPVQSFQFEMLEDALLEAGTAAAQDVVAVLLERRHEPEFYYKRLLVKLGITAPLLSSKLLNKLFELKLRSADQSLSDVTGLALANNARLAEEERNYTEKKRITDFLYNCFNESGKSREDTMQWLKEAGNAGDENVLTILPLLFASNDSAIHKEAVYSLRFVAGNFVDSILAEQLTGATGDYAAFLAGIYRLRWPAPVMRSAISGYLRNSKQKSEEAVKLFTNYLADWNDEGKDSHVEARTKKNGIYSD